MTKIDLDKVNLSLLKERDWARKQLFDIAQVVGYELPVCISSNPEECMDEACPACIPPFEHIMEGLIFKVKMEIDDLNLLKKWHNAISYE